MYKANATYSATGDAAAGIIIGGSAPGNKNADASVVGIGGFGSARAGSLTVDGASLDLVCTTDSIAFLNCGIPASAVAAADAFSFLAGDGTSTWTCDNGILHSLEIKWEKEQHLMASVQMDAIKSVFATAAPAQEALASAAPIVCWDGGVQYNGSNVNAQSVSIKAETKYEPYWALNASLSTPKRAPLGFIRTGFQVSAELECLSRIDSTVEVDAPVPAGNLVLTGTGITITVTLTSGIVTGGDAWGFAPDGIQTFKYSFLAPPNAIALTIA